MATDPVIVHGNYGTAIAVFVEDARGDLVDINFYCPPCNRNEEANAMPWPCYGFSPDYDTNCCVCGELINSVDPDVAEGQK